MNVLLHIKTDSGGKKDTSDSSAPPVPPESTDEKVDTRVSGLNSGLG